MTASFLERVTDTPADVLRDRLERALPALGEVDDATIRLVDERAEHLTMRQGQIEPVYNKFDLGAMVTIWADGGLGYAATSDLSDEGLAAAVDRARHWAGETAKAGIRIQPPLSSVSGTYGSTVQVGWDEISLTERIDLLHQQSDLLNVDPRVVSRSASLARREVDMLLLTASGAEISQQFRYVYPSLRVTAAQGSEAQTRTFGGHAYCGQGGAEVLGRFGFGDAAHRVAEQAIQLLTAENCPSGTMDALLAPDQMILQIHESIGHPLELDRILGDERNYAGTSFVTKDMFGSYQYGSELLNVTFDPTVDGQLASYAFDDEGTPAKRHHLIENGTLVRGLGGAVSQERSGIQGVANARASSWNRPPIDRMANLNVEPGNQSFEELVSSVERGVYMETNNSWSIDDSRNKFQFSCEYARLIEDGQLKSVVRNPSYRGISETFWRSLKGLGNRDTWKAMGTPNCGKGELNQQVGTGHAAPVCLFGDIEVFGGEN